MQPNVRLGGEADTAGAGEVPSGVGGGELYSLIRQSIGGERWMYVACIGAALVFVGMTLYDIRTRTGRERRAKEQRIVKGVSASELLKGRSDLFGNKDAPYTLVEFGDYECPPCRAQQAVLKEVLRQYANKVRFDFRNFPLEGIHPHALSAALAVEASREQGGNILWQTHERYFSADLTTVKFDVDIMKDKAARTQMKEDSSLAKKLQVSGTPSFFLCFPDGKVVRLEHLSSIESAI